jgi:3-hydroxyisobutyrate dehydrogenase-like beta-hydroxyacid dehydrogenase
MSTKYKIGFIGLGEIGTSVYNIHTPFYSDLKRNDVVKKFNDSVSDCDVVNISIPFFNLQFFKNVLRDNKLKEHCLVIIHSTIPPNTTKELQEEFPQVFIIHSPVRGIHPNLEQGLLTFEKYFGLSEKLSSNDEYLQMLTHYIKTIYPKFYMCKSKESELAKVFSTTFYGLVIAAVKDVKNICDLENVDFDVVYTRWQQQYNDGYTTLNMPHVVRPVLKPMSSNIIGGHCVLPNAQMLDEMYDLDLTKYILRYSDKTSIVHQNDAKNERKTEM